MNQLLQLYHSFRALYRAHFLKKNTLLLVTWQITDHSHYDRPLYEMPSRSITELNSSEIIDVIEQIYNAGVLRVILTDDWGDPLSRFDIGNIVDQFKEKKISIYLETHGFFVEHKIEIVKLVDRVILPLDGPQDVHDDLRYAGSYDEVLRAARVLKENAVPFIFKCTLTSKNIEHVDAVLEIAGHYNTGVYFQPIIPVLPDERKAHPLLFSSDRMKQVMMRLMRLRKKQYPNILNSDDTLSHLYHYPDTSLVYCESRYITVHIDVNGDCMHCPWVKPAIIHNVLKEGLIKSFDQLPPISCMDCWHAFRLDLHKKTAFSLRNIIHFWD